MKNIKLVVVSFIFAASVILFSIDINVNGYKLSQYNASFIYTMPDTVIPEGYFLIICRGSKTQAEFESFWGVTLGSNVMFFDSVSPLVPQQNGGELFSLHDALDNFIDSTTDSQLTTPRSIQRDSSNVMTFTYFYSSQANPGSFANGGHGAGLVITEVGDSAGIGNYLYEFVEIYNDGGIIINTPPLISGLTHTPPVPVNLEKVIASCNITDNSAVSADSLIYRVDFSLWLKVYRDSIVGNTRYYSIPGQTNSSFVQYYVWAIDDEGLTSVSDTNSYTVGAVSQTKVKKVLFDYTKNQTAGNADWIIDTNYPIPLPANPTAETDWLGGISSWGFELDTAHIYNSNSSSFPSVPEIIEFEVYTLPPESSITYGTTGPMDLKNYDVYIVCEPQNPFTSAESTAIFNYVLNGGGLFMVADHVASDRDADGWDSPQVWQAIGSDAFGMHFYQVGEGNNNLTVSTSTYDTSNDTIVNGPFGSVIGGNYNFHGGTMIQQSAAALEVAIYNSSYSMLSVAFYGAHNGRVAGTGDSSPFDDSTGNTSDDLYDGWNEGIDRLILLNTTYWLSIDSLDYTQSSYVDSRIFYKENYVSLSIDISDYAKYFSIKIFRKLLNESSFTLVRDIRPASRIFIEDTLPINYKGIITYKIIGVMVNETVEIGFFDVNIKLTGNNSMSFFTSSDFLHINGMENERFFITDITGREVVSGIVKNGKIMISGINSGIYFLKFENYVESGKIIKF